MRVSKYILPFTSTSNLISFKGKLRKEEGDTNGLVEKGTLFNFWEFIKSEREK